MDATAGPDEPDERSALHRLAVRASNGESTALDDLVTALYADGHARRAVSSVLIDRDAIDEAAQESVIAAARSIRSFRAESSFETWFWTIGRRCAIRVLQVADRELTIATDGVDDAQASEIARISSMIATRRTVEDVIALLPEKYAAAVYLRDVAGHTYDEIAERLAMNLNTVRTRIARGRALAAAQLDPASNSD